MDVIRKSRTQVTVHIVLEEWEARDLATMLERVKTQTKVSKSNFSLREKSTGRKLLEALQPLLKMGQ